MSDFWSDESRVEKLKLMWTEGLSGSKIGLVLGCTRCAVISKAHRIGLPMRGGLRGKARQNRYMTAPTQIAKRTRPANNNSPLRAILRQPTTAHHPHQDAADDLAIPVAHRKKLVDLETGDCRWPIGDPQHADFGFCGKPQLGGTPYCTAHARRAYETVEMRRKSQQETMTERAKEMADA